MTTDEIKEAFKKQIPVVSRDITYSHISALIYRLRGGKLVLTVELMDKNRNSVTIADCERVRPAAI